MDIKRIIKEEVDDLDWIRDEMSGDVNIFYDTSNTLFIDVPITKEELTTVIYDIYTSGNRVGDTFNTAASYLESVGYMNGTLEILLGWSRSHGFTFKQSFGDFAIYFGKQGDGTNDYKYSEIYKSHNTIN